MLKGLQLAVIHNFNYNLRKLMKNILRNQLKSLMNEILNVKNLSKYNLSK